MSSKLTLITPPDIFENSNPAILFVHLSDNDQDIVSKWLSQRELDHDLNLYVYNGEPDVEWFFWACGVSEHKYIDLDGTNDITKALSGYVLGKTGFAYKTSDENLAAVYSHINNNRVSRIEAFLEKALGGKNS